MLDMKMMWSSITSYPSFACSIPKHKLLIIEGDVNAEIGINENTKFSQAEMKNS